MRNEGADDLCPTAYRNDTGVVLAVTIGPQSMATTIVYTSRPQTAIWGSYAYAYNSTTSQTYVQPGGWYCPISIDRQGSFWVTVFKANAPQSEYLTPYTVWTQVPDGVEEWCSSWYTNGDTNDSWCNSTEVRRYFIRTYLDGRTPDRIRVIMDAYGRRIG